MKFSQSQQQQNSDTAEKDDFKGNKLRNSYTFSKHWINHKSFGLV